MRCAHEHLFARYLERGGDWQAGTGLEFLKKISGPGYPFGNETPGPPIFSFVETQIMLPRISRGHAGII